MSWIGSIINGVGNKFVALVTETFVLIKDIDEWWVKKTKDQKKNIRNNFQKCILVIALITMSTYDTIKYNTSVRRNADLIDLIQKKDNEFNKWKLDAYEAENKELIKKNDKYIQLQIEVAKLKAELKLEQ